MKVIMLEGYVTSSHTTKEVNGEKIVITTFQNEHSDEYLLEDVQGREFQLFYKGIIQLSWTKIDESKTGGFTLFEDGIAMRSEKFDSFFGKDHRYIINGETKMDLIVCKGESNQMVYRGGFDSVESMKREGKGMEFDEQSGRLLRCGVWKRDELFQITQEFESEDVMIEYKTEEGKENVSVVNRHPMYKGGYVYDEGKGEVLRDGIGYEMESESGLCEQKGEWKNGELLKGQLLHQGWYTQGSNTHSLRCILLDNVHMVVHNRNEWENVTSYVTHLTIAEKSCNDTMITLFDLSGMKDMKCVEIGNECFMHAEKTKLIGMAKLERVVIGSNCFTEKKNAYDDNPSRAFYLKDCCHVRQLIIGCYSFSDYSTCEIADVPMLEVIEMGDLNDEHCSCSFFSSSFELKSGSVQY